MIFTFDKTKPNVKTEITAGFTTFVTMAYILAVNPSILSATGMDRGAVFTATALAAVIGTMVMAFLAKLPYALAPGMGINAYFAYTVVLTMGYTWEMALAAVFIEGLIFILLTAVNIREAIVDAIPLSLKYAISVGIGLFIAVIGLQHAGIIVKSDATMITMGNLKTPVAIIALTGLLVSGVLLILKVRGALLIGILVATVAGLPLGVTVFPSGGIVATPPSLEPVFMKFDFSRLFSYDMLIIIFSLLFMDMFDTVGTLLGVSAKTGMINKDGKIPRIKEAFFADAIATTAGAMLGTSTTTTYVESAAGVAEGGRTGLTAFVTGVLLLLSLLLAPLFLMIPEAATAPALILVGLFMLSPVTNIKFDDFTEAIPAFLTIIVMPMAYSISDGIAFGFISYVLLKLLTGKVKEISWFMLVLSLFFILKFIL